MKNFLTFSILLLVLVSSSSAETTQERIFEGFLRKVAPSYLAWGHPTAQYVSCQVEAYGQKCYLDVYYRSAWTGKLLVMKSYFRLSEDGELYAFKVYKDTGFIPPFAALTLIKEVLAELFKKEESNREADRIIRYLKREWESLDAADICILLLHYQWIADGYKKAWRQSS